jgi:hypothetical protein
LQLYNPLLIKAEDDGKKAHMLQESGGKIKVWPGTAGLGWVAARPSTDRTFVPYLIGLIGIQ